MCGIVAVTARRDCTEILLEGLRRLEYRGYDSAGIALIDRSGNLQFHKREGRVAALEEAQQAAPIQGALALRIRGGLPTESPLSRMLTPISRQIGSLSFTTVLSKTTPNSAKP